MVNKFAPRDADTDKRNKLKVENPAEPEFRALEGNLDATGRRFAIVVARFNAFITERLLQSACDGLLRSGASREDIEIARVPGALEIPSEIGRASCRERV